MDTFVEHMCSDFGKTRRQLLEISLKRGTGLTFDDVSLVTGFAKVPAKETSTRSRVTAKGDITVDVPVITAGMESVTDENVAIAAALNGSLGVLWQSEDIESQIAKVRTILRHRQLIVPDPKFVRHDMTMQEAWDFLRQGQFGFSTLPVVRSGVVCGMLDAARFDIARADMMDQPVSRFMIPRSELVIGHSGMTPEEALRCMQGDNPQGKTVGKLIIVNPDGSLAGLTTAKTFAPSVASHDHMGQLRVGVAIGVPLTRDIGKRVAECHRLYEAGASFVVIDIAHGAAQWTLDLLSALDRRVPQLPVMAGNVAHPMHGRMLADAGAAAVKVGIGGGRICTTRKLGIGVPQILALLAVAEALRNHDVTVIADGGIRDSGDVAKAIAAGADCCMAGGIFASTKEAPGDAVIIGGKEHKKYYGEGSARAHKRRATQRYGADVQGNEPVSEGDEGAVPVTGSIAKLLQTNMKPRLQRLLEYTGSASVDDLRENARFVLPTLAGIREGHLHNLVDIHELS